MRLLLDNGLPRSAVKLLAALGHDSIHVGDVGMAGASDSDIMARASKDGLVVVTLDADFHTILALSGADSPSVVRIRIEGLKAEGLVRILQTVLSAFENELLAGAAVTVSQTAARSRKLPLV